MVRGLSRSICEKSRARSFSAFPLAKTTSSGRGKVAKNGESCETARRKGRREAKLVVSLPARKVGKKIIRREIGSLSAMESGPRTGSFSSS